MTRCDAKGQSERSGSIRQNDPLEALCVDDDTVMARLQRRQNVDSIPVGLRLGLDVRIYIRRDHVNAGNNSARWVGDGAGKGRTGGLSLEHGWTSTDQMTKATEMKGSLPPAPLEGRCLRCVREGWDR